MTIRPELLDTRHSGAEKSGGQDLFIACVDGLTGFPEAIAATYPETLVQLCRVHFVRSSVTYVSDKHRKEVCADLWLF
jgi:putative transposase